MERYVPRTLEYDTNVPDGVAAPACDFIISHQTGDHGRQWGDVNPQTPWAASCHGLISFQFLPTLRSTTTGILRHVEPGRAQAPAAGDNPRADRRTRDHDPPDAAGVRVRRSPARTRRGAAAWAHTRHFGSLTVPMKYIGNRSQYWSWPGPVRGLGPVRASTSNRRPKAGPAASTI
jgi:hypothetical protein